MNDTERRALQAAIAAGQAAEQARRERHAPDCFGSFNCQSCGCDATGRLYGKGPQACVSHAGRDRYLRAVWEAEQNRAKYLATREVARERRAAQA